MPAPPAALTLRDLSIRALPPRWQRTTLPVTSAGSSALPRHSWAAAGSAPARVELAESTTPVAGSAAVTEAPLTSNGRAPAGVIVAVAWNVRAGASAPTEVSQGAVVGVATVPASGPELPAALATNTPASDAPRKASCTGSATLVFAAPPIE